jgi:hypothetical protein
MFIKLTLSYTYTWLLSSLNFLDLTCLSDGICQTILFFKIISIYKNFNQKKVYCTPKSHKLHYIAKVRK